MPVNDRGFSTIEFLIGAVLITFIIFIPIVMQMEMHSIHILEQELDRTLQMSAVEGSVTSNIEKITAENLEKRGLEFIDYTDDTTTTSVNRGGTIHVGIIAKRSSDSLFSQMMGLIGGDEVETDTIMVEGSIMSEFIP